MTTVLRALDLRSGSYHAYSGTVSDIAALKPTVTNSLEAGYKGLVGKRLVFDAVAYMTRRQNFIAPLAIITPNVFLSTPSLAAYLGRFLPAAQAGALAAAIGGIDGNPSAAGIPLATVGPTGALGGSDILLSYHNVGDVKLWGGDVSGDFTATDRVTLSGAYSYVSKDFFAGAFSGSSDLSTNTPRNKALASVRYREPAREASLEVRGRYVEGFRMVDGVWNGRVNTFAIADIEGGAAVPNVPDARFTVTVQNALNKRHSEFVAAPILGRLVMARLQYRF